MRKRTPKQRTTTAYPGSYSPRLRLNALRQLGEVHLEVALARRSFEAPTSRESLWIPRVPHLREEQMQVHAIRVVHMRPNVKVHDRIGMTLSNHADVTMQA